MSNNGFEFSGFFASAVEREFLPQEGLKEGQGVTLSLNLDLLTLEYMEHLETELSRIAAEAWDAFRMIPGVEEPEAKPAPRSKKSKTSKTSAIEVAGKRPTPTPTPTPTKLPNIDLFVFEKARCRFWASALAGKPGTDDANARLIRDWNVVRDGKKVPISYESFIQMPYHGLQKLYSFVIGEANNPTPQEKKASATT